jgi:hypothetical protein
VNVFFPAAADLVATDRLLIGEQWYEVEGEPERWGAYVAVKAWRAVS